MFHLKHVIRKQKLYSMQYKTICIDLVHNFFVFTLGNRQREKGLQISPSLVQKVATETSKPFPV